MGSIQIESIASSVPPQNISSQDFINKASNIASDQVIDMMAHMNIESRYSVIENYVNYLSGEVDRNLIHNVNDLALQSIESCIEHAKEPLDIGLFITITNTAARPLPCMAYELIAMTSPQQLPRDVCVVNMQNQGCSVLVKAIEMALCYMQANPGKHALITIAEAQTAMTTTTLNHKKILSFKEISSLETNERGQESLKLNNLINSFLFGDGAISMVLSYQPEIEDCQFYHLTNINPRDTELLHMDEGGSCIPAHKGFPHYLLSKDVPDTGVCYSKQLLQAMMDSDKFNDEVNLYLVHTGSKKILDKVRENLGLKDDFDKISTSYFILKNFGNLSSCSIGFMLDRAINVNHLHGDVLIVSFGVGFSASLAKFRI